MICWLIYSDCVILNAKAWIITHKNQLKLLNNWKNLFPTYYSSHVFPRLELNYLLFSIKQVPFKNTLTHYVISASPAEVALGPFKHDSAPEDRESHQPVNWLKRHNSQKESFIRNRFSITLTSRTTGCPRIVLAVNNFDWDAHETTSKVWILHCCINWNTLNICWNFRFENRFQFESWIRKRES